MYSLTDRRLAAKLRELAEHGVTEQIYRDGEEYEEEEERARRHRSAMGLLIGQPNIHIRVKPASSTVLTDIRSLAIWSLDNKLGFVSRSRPVLTNSFLSSGRITAYVEKCPTAVWVRTKAYVIDDNLRSNAVANGVSRNIADTSCSSSIALRAACRLQSYSRRPSMGGSTPLFHGSR